MLTLAIEHEDTLHSLLNEASALNDRLQAVRKRYGPYTTVGRHLDHAELCAEGLVMTLAKALNGRPKE